MCHFLRGTKRITIDVCRHGILSSSRFENDVFEHIHMSEELFRPKNPPLHTFSVPTKAEWDIISDFRPAYLDTELGAWVTHPTKASSHGRYYESLRYFSLVMVFIASLQFYWFLILLIILHLKDKIAPHYIRRSINKRPPDQMSVRWFPVYFLVRISTGQIATGSNNTLQIPLRSTCRVYMWAC
jgi:hypothetical protein